MALPPTCSACSFYVVKGRLCRRHAPGPASEEMEIAHWPTIARPKVDRCGSGEAVGDGEDGPVRCSRCIHFFQPGGKPLDPSYRQGMEDSWWAESGLCTRYAPGPSGEEGRTTYWRVVTAKDGCGDGEAVG